MQILKIFCSRWILFIISIMAILIYHFYFIQIPPATSIELQQSYKYKLILVPLDTRPPCQKMVIDAGKMAGIDIITPPSDLMDYYTKAGDTKALQTWLFNNINNSDGAIISIDQLLHGGLLASRESGTKPDKSLELLSFIRQLKLKAPDKPIYAFNILPRITPPPTLDSDSKKMIKISRLIDEISIFGNQEDIALLVDLKKDINSKDLDIYLDLFRRNTILNKALINLANEGIITKLVIGQDDGEDFGIPNMEKKVLANFLHSQNINSDKVIITKGADEVALSLLANFVQTKTNYQPKVYVEYNDTQAIRTIMPFMAGSVGSTVNEKLMMSNAQQVDSPDKAGLILYIFIGDDNNIATQKQSALTIKKYLSQGKKVALVDLSYHFVARETLFPILLKQQVPINELTAYAGWNTASNSIGTALANAIIYKAIKPTFNTTNDILALEYNRLTINYARFLEDYYYLKEVIDTININLRNFGYTNVNDLDLAHNYIWTNDLLQNNMQMRSWQLSHSTSSQMPFKIQTPNGIYNLIVRNLTIETYFPWPRTFEISLDAKLNLYQLLPN